MSSGKESVLVEAVKTSAKNCWEKIKSNTKLEDGFVFCSTTSKSGNRMCCVWMRYDSRDGLNLKRTPGSHIDAIQANALDGTLKAFVTGPTGVFSMSIVL